MRTLFILSVLLIASAMAKYIPDWQLCGGMSASWYTTIFTLDEDPVRSQNSTYHICGKNPRAYVTIFNSYTIETPNNSTSVPISPVEVYLGDEYCFDIVYEIPCDAADLFKMKLELIGDLQEIISCYSITIEL